jgi:hypothetical protein
MVRHTSMYILPNDIDIEPSVIQSFGKFTMHENARMEQWVFARVLILLAYALKR